MRGRVAALCASALAAAAAAAPASAGPGLFVGVQEENISTLTTGVPVVRDLGLSALRVPIQWRPGLATLDPEQQASLDALVASASRIRLLANVWSLGVDAPRDDVARAQFCSFARSVAVRYRAIKDVLVGNEPNKPLFWQPQFHPDGSSASPAAYTALLAHCYDVLHAARRDVNVVAPALSPAGNDNPNARSNISHTPMTFIRRMGEAYRASGRTRRLFDTWAHNAYGSHSAERPWARHDRTTQISQGDWEKHRATLLFAFAGTPQAVPGQCYGGGCVWIWYTETGFQTTPDEAKRALYRDEENVLTVPDEAGGDPALPWSELPPRAPDQATQVVDAVRLAYCQPYVQAIFNFGLVDHASLARWQSGFLWPDWTPKDSYPAVKQVAAQVRSRSVDCATIKGGPLAPVDVNRPTAPAWKRVSTARRRVTLDWLESRDLDVMGYRVYRATKRRGPYAPLTARLVETSSYVDRRVRRGRTYFYAVAAVDTVENEGRRSRIRAARPGRVR